MNLNFKEQLTDFAIDKVAEIVDDAIGGDEQESVDIEPINNNVWVGIDEPLPTNVGDSVHEAKADAKQLLDKVDAKNVFTLPSVLVILYFMLSTVFVDVYQALDDNTLSASEYFKLFYLALGGVVHLVVRASEGRTGAYTPHGLPGLNKEDFIDVNKDGIDDRHQ